MKVIILLFSLMFVSCVTANTKSRDLSGVNPEPELSSAIENKNINTAFNWKFWEWREEKAKRKQHITDCRSQCERGYYDLSDPCYRDSPSSRELRMERCFRSCYRDYSKKEGVKVTSIGDQNPFDLLKESQDDFTKLQTEDHNHKDKAPIMLAMDYDCCVKTCIDDGGSGSECHRGCEE